MEQKAPDQARPQEFITALVASALAIIIVALAMPFVHPGHPGQQSRIARAPTQIHAPRRPVAGLPACRSSQPIFALGCCPLAVAPIAHGSRCWCRAASSVVSTGRVRGCKMTILTIGLCSARMWASGLPGCTCNLFLCPRLFEGRSGSVRRIEKGIVTVRRDGRPCEGSQLDVKHCLGPGNPRPMTLLIRTLFGSRLVPAVPVQ